MAWLGAACTTDRLVQAPTSETVSAPAVRYYYTSADQTYTLNADFDQGSLLNLNHNIANQLQLNTATQPFPFIWVAASDRGTIIRIDVNTGAILGEFYSSPTGRPRNPSRTTVDQWGNVWATNRDETGYIGAVQYGSTLKIGLVLGGTRADQTGTPSPTGQYVKPPFGYNTCVDRDGDGMIRTSYGLGNILAWPNLSDGVGSTDGAAHVAQVQDAQDECILVYQRLPDGPGARHVSVTSTGDVWVAGFDGYTPHSYLKLDQNTGAILATFNARNIVDTDGVPRGGCGGYGGLIDGNNVLWSASLSQARLLRYDLTTYTGKCIYNGGLQSYGLGLDHLGNVWNAEWTNNVINKYDPAGALFAGFPKSSGGSGSRGVAVTSDNNVWVANSYSNTVTRLDNSGTVLATIGVGNHPTGVAVDANGKVWVTNYYASTVMRIDPALNAVDLTVSLGAGAGPYNYSDMTGMVVMGGTSPQGTWSIVQDGSTAGKQWGMITWNTEAQGSVPAGASIVVEARAADTQAGLTGQSWIPVTNGVTFALAGRFIEVRATLKASPTGASPILSDLRIASDQTVPTCVLTGQGIDASGRKYIDVTARDQQTGLQSIIVTRLVNGVTTIPPFAIGTTSPVVVHTTKTNPALTTSLGLQVTDVAGNVTNCDPVDATVDRTTSQPVETTFTGLPAAEHLMDIYNADPGLTSLGIDVNGKHFQVAGLKAAEHRALDVASAMVPGNGNTVVLRPTGRPGSNAWVLIHD